jgi:hypothetical protein
MSNNSFEEVLRTDEFSMGIVDSFSQSAAGFNGGSGGGSGGSSGMIIGAIGGGLSGLLGGYKKGDAAVTTRKALAKLDAIPLVDPNQFAFKDQLMREKKAVESGFSTDFQVARDIIGKSEAGGMSVAAEIAQTNPALSLMMMGQIGAGVDTSVNKALATIGTKGMGYSQAIADMVNQMSARELQLTLAKTTYRLGMATKSQSDINANANAKAASMGSMGGIDVNSIVGLIGNISKMGKSGGSTNGASAVDTGALNTD